MKRLNKSIVVLFTCLLMATIWESVSAGILDRLIPGEEYEVESLDIPTINLLSSYSWCDNNHIAIAKVEHDVGRGVLLYLDIRDKTKTTEIKLVGKDGKTRPAGQILCHDDQILSIFSGQVYSVKAGESPRLIAALKQEGPWSAIPINIHARYIVANKPRLRTDDHYEVSDECATQINPGYRVLCWNTWWFRTVWPFSQYALLGYSWFPEVPAPDTNGKFRDVPNQEKPLVLESDGHPAQHALLLFDLQGNLLTRLDDEPDLRIDRRYVVADPSERYMYAACTQQLVPRRDFFYDAVCRYPLDGKHHKWEEVFVAEIVKKSIVGIGKISVADDGNVFFSLPGAKPDYRGTWKYDAITKKVSHITQVQFGQNDEAISVSPDGKKIAFIREEHRGSILYVAYPK